MAITPRSKGLGNIGSIVNRQRLASPARPQPKPAPKPAPKLAPAPTTSRNPFAGGKTTTIAQRQAMSPFKSATKPVNKIDPMQAQYDQMKNVPMAPPPGGVKAMPFNPQPNPGQMPLDQLIRPEVGRDQADVQREVEAMMNRFNPQPTPGQQPLQQGIQGLGQMFGNLSSAYGFGGQQTPMQQPAYIDQGGTAEQWNQFNQGSGGGMGMSYTDPYSPGGMNPMIDYGGPAGMQPGQMFGNPNPMTSDYDELEGSAFNTNPSSGSLFGGGGFSGR